MPLLLLLVTRIASTKIHTFSGGAKNLATVRPVLHVTSKRVSSLRRTETKACDGMFHLLMMLFHVLFQMTEVVKECKTHSHI